MRTNHAPKNRILASVAACLLALLAVLIPASPARADDADIVYNPRSPQCYTSGNAFQVVYAYNADVGNDTAAKLPAIRLAVREAIGLLWDQSGGARDFRFVTQGACVVNVISVAVPQSELEKSQFLPTVYNDPSLQSYSRNYLVFRDDPHQTSGYTGCGQAGHVFGSLSSPSSVLTHPYKDRDNPSNTGRGYGELMAPDSGHPNCWRGKVVAHEMFHLLGAALDDAPNASGGGHVEDIYDIMDDTGPVEVCGNASTWPQNTVTIDCNGDDYFNLSPGGSNFLASNWNTADSSFLIGGGPASTSTGVPATVAGFSVFWATCSQATVSWTSVSTNAGYRLRLFRDLASGTDPMVAEKKVLGGVTYSIDNNGPGTGLRHKVTLQAINSYGTGPVQTITNPSPACTP